MLQICPNLSGQKFEDPPFEEEILSFIRELGYPRDIKLLSDVKGTDISQKDEKNQAKSDKTGHEMEKCVKAKPNQSQVNSEKKKQRKM
ncbi:hypothetical protein Tco_1429964 [Tanacetum coccineum]